MLHREWPALQLATRLERKSGHSELHIYKAFVNSATFMDGD